jgi:hypothetical protein
MIKNRVAQSVNNSLASMPHIAAHLRVDGGLGRVCKTVACVFYPPPSALGLMPQARPAGKNRPQAQPRKKS